MKTLLITTFIMIFFGLNLTEIEKNEHNLIETNNEQIPCFGTLLNDCVELCIYDTSQTIKYQANGTGGVVDIWIVGCSKEVYFCDNCPTSGTISKNQFSGEVCSGIPCTNYSISITYKRPDGTHCNNVLENFCW
ncbi:hypothetical protein [Moheibacter sp.]|uniref:hypothetical protein n=1 Tax=Moheibacter sp. TaxID=1965316 RepID=UPI003C72DED3